MTKGFHTPLARAICLRYAFALAATLLACWPAGTGAAEDAYRLSPGDRIALRVVTWDTISSQLAEVAALSGAYVVGPAGNVMVPMLGSIGAAGLSPAELAETVAAKLQSRLGLGEPPGASIEITGFRPIYILGAVAAPGPYEFSLGLTVQQALALAGGVEEVLAGQSDGLGAAIRAAGTLKEIGITLAREQIRAARLRAEMEGAADFDAAGVSGHPGGPAAVAAALDHERSLFQSRRDAQERALAALDDSRAVLENEIATLEEQLDGQARQVALARKSLADMETLVERGLARSPNFVNQQRQLIDLENRKLETETAVFRARQAIAELERDRVDIEAGRGLEVLRELQQADAEIERLQARRDTTRQLLAGAEALLMAGGATPVLDIAYRITREGSEGRAVLAAGPETVLKPGDVLEVEVHPVAEEGG